MRLSRLGIKITLVLLSLIVISLIIFSVVFLSVERERLKSDIISKGRVFADFSSSSIYGYYATLYTHPSIEEFEKFKTVVRNSIKNNDDITKVALIGVNGKILFDSSEFDTGKYSGSGRFLNDSLTLVLLGSDETVFRETPAGGEIFTPIKDVSGNHVVSMLYTLSYKNIERDVASMAFGMVMLLIPVFVASGMIVVFFSSKLVEPILKLTELAKKVGEGDLNIKVKIKSNDEIGQLSSSFEKMTSDIRKSHDQIKQHSRGLEKQIKERTKQLEAKNAELERFNKLAIGRELRMVELKKEVEKIKRKKGS